MAVVQFGVAPTPQAGVGIPGLRRSRRAGPALQNQTEPPPSRAIACRGRPLSSIIKKVLAKVEELSCIGFLEEIEKR